MLLAVIIGLFGSLLGLLIALAAWTAAEGTHRSSTGGKLIRTLPLCSSCSQDGIPRPEYVDYTRQEITFIVHNDFHRRFTQT